MLGFVDVIDVDDCGFVIWFTGCFLVGDFAGWGL